MAWEIIEKGEMRGRRYGDQWTKIPAVVINKSGITVNAPFCEAYVNGSSEMLVMLDRQNFRIGLRSAKEGDFNGLRLTKPAGGARCIPTKAPGTAFPDNKGRAYRARLNPDSRVIEVELTSANELR